MHLIGVTPYVRENGALSIGKDYMAAIIRAGMLPVVLPLTDCRATLDAALNAIDGLVLSGGGDIDPKLLGEEKRPETEDIAPIRDETEFYLVRRAVEMDMPILAICRGVQVLSVALGGRMYQDIGAQYSRDIEHTRMDIPAGHAHDVTVKGGTLLHGIVGRDTLAVNSRHHQAVRAIPEGFTVCATAPDGLIEAVEKQGARFCLGVQWHPESMSAERPEQQALFDALKIACEERKPSC